MNDEADFIRAEIAGIEEIVRNECWLEGERRGCFVDPRDQVVQEHVADIILSGVGAQLRRVYSERGHPGR